MELELTTQRRKPLSYYLRLNYPFIAQVEEDGEYFVTFPDLDGCMTGAPTLEELPTMMREAMEGWLGVTRDHGQDVPEPTILRLDDSDYSGKFNLRLPRSLHRALADGAERDGVSLNQYVVSLLSRKGPGNDIERRVDAIERRLESERPRETKIAEERARYDAGRTKKAATRKSSPRRRA